MERKNKKYTRQEDNIILSRVSENPNRLLTAFDIAAQQLSRTPSGVCQRWYSTLRDRENTNCFLTVGKRSSVKNKKNCNSTVVHRPSIWRKLINLFN